MKPHIAIAERDLEAVAVVLNDLLCSEYVLYTKTRNYHWNVIGPHFNDLHAFFESQYEVLNEFVDEVAERVRTLGSRSYGTLAEFARYAQVKETPGESLDASQMIASLLADHETVIRALRASLTVCEKHHDEGTFDFLTGLMERHEKMAWMLRAFLAGEWATDGDGLRASRPQAAAEPASARRGAPRNERLLRRHTVSRLLR